MTLLFSLREYYARKGSCCAEQTQEFISSLEGKPLFFFFFVFFFFFRQPALSLE